MTRSDFQEQMKATALRAFLQFIRSTLDLIMNEIERKHLKPDTTNDPSTTNQDTKGENQS